MIESSSILIVLPAYNAEKTLEQTLQEIPEALTANLFLVDDASRDHTVEKAKALGIPLLKHTQNHGYGANQKSCYQHALTTTAQIIVMVHPDDQYDARMIPALILPIQLGICDVMLGNRIRTRREALSGGMPLYKYFFNRFLTLLENLLLGQNLGEFHSGMRAYHRKVLEQIPFEKFSDDFVFDQQFLIATAWQGWRIGDVPVPARYFREASSISFFRSVTYGVLTLKTLAIYLLARGNLTHPTIFSKNNSQK